MEQLARAAPFAASRRPAPKNNHEVIIFLQTPPSPPLLKNCERSEQFLRTIFANTPALLSAPMKFRGRSERNLRKRLLRLGLYFSFLSFR